MFYVTTGYKLALIEIFIFVFTACILRIFTNFNKLNAFVYYWSMFTILTGIWELFFVFNYDNVIRIANNLIKTKTHVWTSNYTYQELNPNNFSQIFYAEYGAYADREYMTNTDTWSRVIESSHSLMCGIFCLLAMINYLLGKSSKFLFALSVGMGSQLMNSILYMANYFNQVKDKDNVNFNTTSFPSGQYLEKRPFMYVNIFWTLMPLVIIFYLLDVLNKNKGKCQSNNSINENTEKDLLRVNETMC